MSSLKGETMKCAINGFGRIGRNFFRVLLEDAAARKDIELVAINLGPKENPATIIHMIKYDTLMGTYKGDVSFHDGKLSVAGYEIVVLAESEPEKLPWAEMGIDWVVECSGHFTSREQAERHLAAGAKAVLISAPAKNEDVTIIPGVNDADFRVGKYTIVSLGSCTTNAFVPTVKVLQDSFGIERGYMTTVHAYTNTQVLLDVNDDDPRRSRAAALNIVPTDTGASKLIGKLIPELAGRIGATSVRVPVAKVSLIDLTFTSPKKLSIEAINQAFTAASEQGAMKGILAITHEPLVSSDFSGDNHSVVIDGLMTDVCNDHMGKVFGWYDNEWGYSVRMKDFLLQRV
jgi:glyceraldehyde 3-phosphate dehydrogenase